MPIAVSATPAPLPGCVPLLTASDLREADRRATHEFGLPSVILMERAGFAATMHVLEHHHALGSAAVLAGTGNNGGDGFAVARHLHGAGWDVALHSPGGRPPMSSDAALMSDIARRLGLVATPLPEDPPGAGTLVVDALLGTGATGAPRGDIARAVAWANAAAGPVVSLDVPTGVDADTGVVAGDAVNATATITFHAATPGLHVAPGRFFAGAVHAVDIGIPAEVALPPAAWLLGAAAVEVYPRRPDRVDKYGSGAVLVVAGSPGMAGAASLAVRSAQRAGAGIVFALVPDTLRAALALAAPEAVLLPADSPDPVAEAMARLGRAGCVLLGPGLGREEPARRLVATILRDADLPIVVDADGLWHASVEALAERRSPTVITPHSGEAARLLGWTRERVDAHRLEAAGALARASGATVVLKGPGTIIATGGEPPIVDRVGGAELATAGSGDVLGGIIARALAVGCPTTVAAATAVAVHGLAGRAAALGSATVAGDLVNALAGVVAAHG
ncbi:MAG: NAD(P)H-hydrate dehydratase [Actinobacteria bacterium]|nr:NAD(P)H-hydrate dehydratase [Actinomycetota bacterium]